MRLVDQDLIQKYIDRCQNQEELNDEDYEKILSGIINFLEQNKNILNSFLDEENKKSFYPKLWTKIVLAFYNIILPPGQSKDEPLRDVKALKAIITSLKVNTQT